MPNISAAMPAECGGGAGGWSTHPPARAASRSAPAQFAIRPKRMCQESSVNGAIRPPWAGLVAAPMPFITCRSQHHTPPRGSCGDRRARSSGRYAVPRDREIAVAVLKAIPLGSWVHHRRAARLALSGVMVSTVPPGKLILVRKSFALPKKHRLHCSPPTGQATGTCVSESPPRRRNDLGALL